MSQRLVLSALLFFVCPLLRASCGSSSCPIDTNALNLPRAGECFPTSPAITTTSAAPTRMGAARAPSTTSSRRRGISTESATSRCRRAWRCATDGVAGISYQSGVVRQMRGGSFSLVPFFASATYQFRTGDANGYRLGNELQLSAGGAYPLFGNVHALVQVNSRFHAKDHIEGEEAEEAFTGGTYVYASPGLRYAMPRGVAIYGLIQIPLYQDVNAIQLTSDRNYIFGIRTRF